MLSAAALPFMLARSADDLVATLRAVAARPSWLEHARAALQRRSSPLFDRTAWLRQLERAVP